MARKLVNIMEGQFYPGTTRPLEPIWGTLKTLHGVPVIEIRSDWYKLQEDPEVEAQRHYRKDGYDDSGWVVSRGYSTFSDPIPTKKEAIQTMTEFSYSALKASGYFR